MKIIVYFALLVFCQTRPTDAMTNTLSLPNKNVIDSAKCTPSIVYETDFESRFGKFVHAKKDVIYVKLVSANMSDTSCETFNCSAILDPMTWIWSRGSGLDILALPLDYDVLSMGLLSDNVAYINTNVIFQPNGCQKYFNISNTHDFVSSTRGYLHSIIKNVTDTYGIPEFNICYRHQPDVVTRNSSLWVPVFIPLPVSFYIDLNCTEYPYGLETKITQSPIMFVVYFVFIFVIMYFPLLIYFTPAIETSKRHQLTMSRLDKPYSFKHFGAYLFSDTRSVIGYCIQCLTITVVIQLPCIIRHAYDYIYHLRITQVMYDAHIPMNAFRLLCVNSDWRIGIVTMWVVGSIALTFVFQWFCRELKKIDNICRDYNTFDCIYFLTGFSGERTRLSEFCAVYDTYNQDNSRRIFFSLINRLLVLSSCKYWVTLVAYSLKPVLPPCCPVHTPMPLPQRVASYIFFIPLSAIMLTVNIICTLLFQNILPFGALIIMYTTKGKYPVKSVNQFDHEASKKQIDGSQSSSTTEVPLIEDGRRDTEQTTVLSAWRASDTDSIVSSVDRTMSDLDLDQNDSGEIISSYLLSIVIILIFFIIIFNFFAESIANLFEFVIFTAVLGLPYYHPKTIPIPCMVIAAILYLLLYITDLSAVYTKLLQNIIERTAQTRSAIMVNGDIPASLFRYVKDQHHPVRGQVMLLISKLILTCVFFYVAYISLSSSSMLINAEAVIRIICYVVILLVPLLCRWLMKGLSFQNGNVYDKSIKDFCNHPENNQYIMFATCRQRISDMCSPVPIHEYKSGYLNIQ